MVGGTWQLCPLEQCVELPVIPGKGKLVGPCKLPKKSGEQCAFECDATDPARAPIGYAGLLTCENGLWLEAACGPFTILKGPCVYSGECLTSPSFPKPYGLDEDCEVAITSPVVLGAVAFVRLYTC